MSSIQALEDDIKSAAKQNGIKVNVEALKKPNYFAERRKSTEGNHLRREEQ